MKGHGTGWLGFLAVLCAWGPCVRGEGAPSSRPRVRPSEWPVRGGNAARTFQGQALPMEAKPKIAWKRRFLPGGSHCFVDIVGDEEAAFLLCRDLSGRRRRGMGGRDHVIAVSLSDGKELWRHEPEDLLAATMALHRGQLLVVSAGGLCALDARRGKEVWRTKRSWGVGPGGHDVVADEGRAYVSLRNGQILAFDARSGRQVWRQKPFPDKNRKPFLTLSAGLLLVARESEADIVALSVKDGALLWRRRLPAFSGKGGNRPSPSGHVSVSGKHVLMAEWALIGFEYTVSRMLALDLQTGEIRKRIDVEKGELAGAFAVEGNRAYVGLGSGKVVCYDVAAGRPLWSTSPPQRRKSGPRYVMSMVALGKVLLAATASGELFGLAAPTGKVLWTVPLEADGMVYDRIAVCGGNVLVTNGAKIWALRPGQAIRRDEK